MCKSMYVNEELLADEIVNSGLKIGFICEKLGISRQGFDNKRNGRTPFTAAEVYVLCDLFRIQDNDKKHKIFCPKG